MIARSSLAISAALLYAVSCVSIGGTQERRLVTLDGIPKEQALRIAQEYVTASRLASLRSAAKAKYSQLTDADLASINLQWQRMSLADGEHVAIEVTFMAGSAAMSPKDVADYLAEQVRRDVRAQLDRR